MKNFFLLSLLLLLGITARSQYSTDKFTSVVEYHSMPTYYVPQDDMTYGVSIYSTKQVEDYLDFDKLGSSYTPSGWSYESSNPYIAVSINIDNFEVIKSYEKQDFEEVKENGTTVKRPVFYAAVDYILPMSINVKSAQEDHTYDNVDSDGKSIVYTYLSPKSYRNPRDAHGYYMENKDIVYEKCINNAASDFYADIAEKITKDYVYGKTSELVPAWLLDSKKSEFFDQYKESKNNIKAIFLNYTLNVNPSTIIPQMKSYLQLLQKEAESLDASDKKQVESKADLLNGIAHIYYALEIFDVAKEYAQKVIDLGDNNGEKLIKKINKYQADLEKYHLSSKHF